MSRPGLLRRVWQAVASRAYETAQQMRQSAWSAPSTSATVEVANASRILRDRARDLVRNNPYAARIVDVWTGNAVGCGITTRWQDARQRAAWARWAETPACDAEGALSWPGMQALAMRAVVESGEVLIRRIPTRLSAANPLGFALQVLEADHIDTAKNSATEPLIVQGIELDAYGRPVAYWLFPQHPGGNYVPGRGLMQSVRVAAEDIIHVYRRRRPGQLRDVTWLAPILTKLRNLDTYEGALLDKATVEAMFTLSVTNPDAEDRVTGKDSALMRDAQGNAIEALETGTILYGHGNRNIEQISPTGGGSHLGYARRTLEAASVGTGLTYDQVTGDLTKANYSSLRAGKIEHRRLVEQVQWHMLVPMLVARVAEWFHAGGIRAGLWEPGLPLGATHTPPAHEMIDPLKDTLALIAQVRAGFVKPQDAVAAFGEDWQDHVEQLRAAFTTLTAAGLIFDIDPRVVGKDGGAQDPKQLAAQILAAADNPPPQDNTP